MTSKRLCPVQIPQRLFIYWESGFATAPPIVQICVESWQLRNPGWDFVKLDRDSIKRWLPAVDGELAWLWEDLSVQKRSDVLRLRLLKEHGGYWADSTLFCRAAIADLFPGGSATGFVGVQLPPNANRFISTFFLGASPGNPLVSRWLHDLENYLKSGISEMTKGTQKRIRKKLPVFFRRPIGTVVWTFKLFGRIWGYPYLIPHYLLNRRILFSPRIRSIFRHSPLVTAGFATRYAIHDSSFREFKEIFLSNTFPFWKLTWRTETSPSFWERTTRLAAQDLERCS